MKTYFNGGIIFTSLTCGFFSFVLSLIFFKLWIAILFSSMFTLLLIIVLPFVLLISNKKYQNIEETISEEILLKENVNLRLEKAVQNGYYNNYKR